MKKFIPLVVLCTMLCACQTGETSLSSPENNSDLLHTLLTNIYNERILNAEISFSEQSFCYLIDGKSYRDLNSNLTYFKYVFNDGYMVYRDDELFEDQTSVENDLAESLIALTNPNLFNDYRFRIEEETYSLIDGDGLFDFYLFPKSDYQLEVRCDDQTIYYDYTFCDGMVAQIKITASNQKIYPYLQNENDFAQYFNNYRIGYDELSVSINNGEDLVFLIVSSTCAACEMSQSLYYEFCIEYRVSYFPVIFLDDLTKEQKNELNAYIAPAYLTQEEIYRLEGYEEYPKGFLTPTAVQLSSGRAKRVMPGFVITMAALLFRMCAE